MRWINGGIVIAAAVIGGAALADTLVVRATGPSASSYPPGKKLPDNAKIMLKPRDVITLLDDRGTRTLTGPGIFPATTTTTSSKATSVIAVLTSERRDSRVRIGAVRAIEGVTDARPNIWMVDVAKPGPVCVTDPKTVTLWRVDAAKAAQGSISEVGGKASAQISWKAGEESQPWPAGLTVSSGGRYRVANGNAPAIEIRTFVVEPATDVTAMADSLMKSGCAAQFDQVVATAAAVSATGS